eukprot:2111394-Rhodomonas_salina.2
MTINGVHHDHAGTNAGENHNHVTIILILHTTMLVITHEYITTRTGSLSLTAPRTLQRGLAMSQARHGLNSATRLRALCDAGTDTAYGALISSDVSRRVQNVRYPSCSLFEYQSNTCPAAARPDFYQETRFIYVADSGKNEPEKRRKKEEKNGPSVR